MTMMRSTRAPGDDGAMLASAALRVVQVRWTATVTSWYDRFGAFGGEAPGRRHHLIALRVELHQADDHDATLEAWLDFGDRRRIVLGRTPVQCRTSAAGGALHVDVFAGGAGDRRLLALSVNGRGEVCFAQSSLLSEAGFEGGTYDPPTARVTAAHGGRASG